MSAGAARVIRVAIVIGLLAACAPIEAAAQGVTGPPQPAVKRWSISVGLAGPSGGPKGQFEGAMRGAQFDQPSPSLDGILFLLFCLFCDASAIPVSTVSNPTSRTGRVHAEYDVTYKYSDRLALGLMTSRTHLGETTGYRRSEGFLYVDSSVRVIAPVAYLRLGERMRIGAGPLVAWTQVDGSDSFGQIYDAPGHADSRYKSVAGGAIVAATVETRPGRRLYFALNGSYRWVAPVTAGPFTAADNNSSASVPRMNVNLSHRTVGVSLGVRF
jgi:hypothetical protein